MMAPISGLWATIQGWAWTIISGLGATIQDWTWTGFLSAATFLISAATLSIVAYTQIIRPWRRRRKLRRPFDAHFVITSRGRFQLSYVVQDDDEHLVKELVVPPDSKISIQISLEPRLSFLERELYFGCGESVVDEGKPRATEWFVPFVVEGVRRSGKPNRTYQGHYTDYNGFYHVREDCLYTKDVRVIGYMLRTGRVGIFPAQIYSVTDDVRGKAELLIRVEQPAKTKMRCVRKEHRRCSIAPSAHSPAPA